jgi:hypothetical protein
MFMTEFMTIDELATKALEAQDAALRLRAQFMSARDPVEVKRLARLLERALAHVWDLESEIDRRRRMIVEMN